MTRIEILKANNIEMIIGDDKKTRTLKNKYTSKSFYYGYNVNLKELEDIFGVIKFREFWY